MSSVPANPKIYHITHASNLPSIIADGGLWSDAKMIDKGAQQSTIGMSAIKLRRLKLPVKCHAGDFVGDYVPFYFCPRSVMLFVIYCGNHPELTYQGGQEPIVHLEADLAAVIEWAKGSRIRWAFSLTNAGAYYTQFRNETSQLDELDWQAISATDFRDAMVKERKQAEFLIRDFFPWDLVERIGVRSIEVQNDVIAMTNGLSHEPAVQVAGHWYY